MAKRTVRDLLVRALDDLAEDELKRFRGKLNEFPVREGYDNIPRGRLEKADPLDVADLLLSFYTEGYAVEVAAKVLEGINCKLQAEKLRQGTTREGDACRSVQLPVPSIGATSGGNGAQAPVPTELHFIDRHREALIQRTATVLGILDMLYGTVLNEEQYQTIAAKGTNQEKMRELYRLVPSWNLHCKDKLYEAIRSKDRFLINDLEGRP